MYKMKLFTNKFPEITISYSDALSFKQMKKLDYYTVEAYKLPIELMMENAGLNLARIASSIVEIGSKVLIGIGKGNNGGGGLVAARRLRAWGFDVYIDIPDLNLNDLPKLQLERAKSFGVKIENLSNPDIFIDAYLGFSQRFPLQDVYVKAISEMNKLNCKKISLDVPTGLSENPNEVSEFINADIVLTLAFPKKVLFSVQLNAEIYVADLGIPKEGYKEFNYNFDIPFEKGSIFKVGI